MSAANVVLMALWAVFLIAGMVAGVLGDFSKSFTLELIGLGFVLAAAVVTVVS